MSRRSICSLVLMLVCLSIMAGTLSTSTSQAKQTSTGAQVASLKQQLEFGLKARRPSEFAFINKVVTAVGQKKIPIRDVYAYFKWARKKRPYQMPYFEFGMRRHALRQYRVKL